MQPPEHAPGAKPLVDAERLGDAQFRKDYNVRLAYVAGAMVKGIASPELVIRMGRAELLSFLGAGGLGLERIEDGIRRIQAALPTGTPWGMNLLHNVNHPELEERTVDLLLRLGLRCVEASAYTVLTPAVVRYRLKGARLSGDRARPANRLMAKLSRPEVARQFVSPPPERIVRALRERGFITDEEALAAARLPMADDLCAESDSGGHTDKGSWTPSTRRPASSLRRSTSRSASTRSGRRPRHTTSGPTRRSSKMTGTRNPDLYVRFGSAPTTSAYDCRPSTSGASETCTLTVPAGQTSAYVMVRGAGSGTASYDLTINYTRP